MDSATDGWAVGNHANNKTTTNVALHWDGTSWQLVTTNPAFFFSAVASFSPTDAWAVGGDQTGSHEFALVPFHWNGTSWALASTLPPPHGVSASQLLGPEALSAASATDMWTVGEYEKISGARRNLVWHWNGARWTVMAVPSPGQTAGCSGLTGVAEISPANVWATGCTGAPGNGDNDVAPVVLHWNGTSWTKVATPDPPGSDGSTAVDGVGAAGSGNIWAVGSYSYYGVDYHAPHTLILRWNGTSWIRS